MTAEETSTIALYEQNADNYVESTVNADMEQVYRRFLVHLRPGARILDVGCGSGRDTLAFLNRGYQVVAIDPTESLARHAEKLTGQQVLRGRAQDIRYDAYFDGVWACASLLHVPAAETPDTLVRLATALRPSGVLYATYKVGTGERHGSDRLFHDMNGDTLRSALGDAGLTVVDLWGSNDSLPGRAQQWVNAVAVKEL